MIGRIPRDHRAVHLVRNRRIDGKAEAPIHLGQRRAGVVEVRKMRYSYHDSSLVDCRPPSSRAFISRENIDLGVDLVGQAVRIVAEALDLRERSTPAIDVDLPTWTPAFRRVRCVALATDTKVGRRIY